MDVDVLKKKGQRRAAAYIQECCRLSNTEYLQKLLDSLLDPTKSIDDWETIEWLRWLMAGGCTPDEFAATVRRYDCGTTCGLVWTANFVAYRCRTCGISPCMSLCADCFQEGNHNGHDYNMFKSQAGGACDCGDTNVMKESGFCHRHGPHPDRHRSSVPDGTAPSDLLCVATAMMPRLFLRLIQHFRQNCGDLKQFLEAAVNADKFITMLKDLSAMGTPMMKVMTMAFTNSQSYTKLTNHYEDTSTDPSYLEFMDRTKQQYVECMDNWKNCDVPEGYSGTDIPSLQPRLVHKTFLEEFVFWVARMEFPQKIVCFLLNLLPDTEYKEAFTRAFVLHYSRIAYSLQYSSDIDTVSNRVVHVSVQLFSNEKLALRMTEQMKLLHVMIISLKQVLQEIKKPNVLLKKGHENTFGVVECTDHIMKQHCYWPMVSDLNNMLSHRPVVLRFLEDDQLIKMWFEFLTLFQGMNANVRELNHHVEFEPNSYYAAFSAELEGSATPLWAIVQYLRDSSTAHLTKNLLRHCRAQLNAWLDVANMEEKPNELSPVSFHLPLHRYFSVILGNGVRNQGMSLAELLPPPHELKAIIFHPLRVQVGFNEIMANLWVRNGLQIRGQAMTYIQCHFCNSMGDPDFFLLQVAMMNLPHSEFINLVVSRFHIMESLSVSSSITNSFLEPEQEMSMMDNCMTFLAMLASIRTCIGMSNTDLVNAEMSTLLCMGDKTHSQLMDLIPEKCYSMAVKVPSDPNEFETVLSRVADYRAPNFEAGGNMSQGMYVPKVFVWEQLYDPIYTLLRAVQRKEYQSSLDRFTEFVKHSGKFKGGSPWPPYRIPDVNTDPYTDPRHLLLSRVLQGVLFAIFYKRVHTTLISDTVISLAVYLLEMALSVCNQIGSQVICPHEAASARVDMEFASWYNTDDLLANLRTEVDSVYVKTNPSVTSDSSADASGDENMEVEGFEVLEGESDSIEPYYRNSIVSTENLVALINRTDYSMDDSRNASRAIAVLPTQPDLPLRTVSTQDQHSDYQVIPLHSKSTFSNRDLAERSSSITNRDAAVEVMVNESMLSLLLKLHSKLSSSPDSYVPFWEKAEAIKIIEDAKLGLDTRLKINLADVSDSSAQPDTSITNMHQQSSPSGQLYQFSYAELYNILHPDASDPSLRIGDGPFFVGKLLDKIAAKDDQCRETIMTVRDKLWPRKPENEEETRAREEREKEERKRRALERKMQIMADFAAKQAAFNKSMAGDAMDAAQDTSTSQTDENMDDQEPAIKPIEYDCIICNQSSPSIPSNPIGLVTLLQSTSVLSHRRKSGSSRAHRLPTTDEEKHELSQEDTMKFYNDKKIEEFSAHFSDLSWMQALSIGWEGGIQIQTCGHHLHKDCLKNYLAALKSQQKHHSINVERGEYQCPLCRQLANCFLPLSSEFGIRKSAVVRDRSAEQGYMATPEVTIPEMPFSQEANLAKEIMKLLQVYPIPDQSTAMTDAITKMMQQMTETSPTKYRQLGQGQSKSNIVLFVYSIARTNLELELVIRGGDLVTVPSEPQPSTSSSLSTTSVSKRCCIAPLLHLLGFHYKVLATESGSAKLWERLLGIQFGLETTVKTIDREVPLLLSDPCAILLQIILQLPVHMDLAFFTEIVQATYNLVYIQILCGLSVRFSEKERSEWRQVIPNLSRSRTTECNNLHSLISNIIRYMEASPLYTPDSDFGDRDYESKLKDPKEVGYSERELDEQIQKKLLPYLRVAALLRHQIYEQDLPFIASKAEEFGALARFLGLGGRRSSNVFLPTEEETEDMEYRADSYLRWVSPTPLKTVWTWCEDLSNFVIRARFSAAYLIENQHLLWNQPKLLELPESYDEIFRYYHRKTCAKCGRVPKEPNVCLVCGTLVCMREDCCKTSPNTCEATQHAGDCGAGTCMFLNINLSTIVVIRGKRACIWGSVYLDSFGEEDRDLKRGRPLFLCKERYELLQNQWIKHRFDHVNRKWIFHRDTL